MYRIVLGEDDLPVSTHRNNIMKGKTYTDKVLITSIKNVNKDKIDNMNPLKQIAPIDTATEWVCKHLPHLV